MPSPCVCSGLSVPLLGTSSGSTSITAPDGDAVGATLATWGILSADTAGFAVPPAAASAAVGCCIVTLHLHKLCKCWVDSGGETQRVKGQRSKQMAKAGRKGEGVVCLWFVCARVCFALRALSAFQTLPHPCYFIRCLVFVRALTRLAQIIASIRKILHVFSVVNF